MPLLWEFGVSKVDEILEHSHNRVSLNPDLKSPRAQEFESKLGSLIVGQERVLDELLTTTGNRYTPSVAMRALRDGHSPDGISAAAGDAYTSAVVQLGMHDIDVRHDVIGMTVFRTQDPTAQRASASPGS